MRGRLAPHHVVGDAVEASGVLGDGAAGVDQAIEGFAGEDAAVDDTYSGDGDDFVAFRGFEPGGFQVEHHVVERLERPFGQIAARRRLQQAEIVKFRSWR